MPPVSARALPPEQNERLRAILREIVRDDFGGTLVTAAKALGVTHATISDVLNGKRGVGQKLLEGIAAHTHRGLDDLLGRRAVVYDLPRLRAGGTLGGHPQWEAASAELRRKIVRRYGNVDEQRVSELAGVSLMKPAAVLSPEFLIRMYEALLQADEDAAESQGFDKST